MTATATAATAATRTRRPHIVYVTAGFPFPLTSGYLRHHFLIGHLAADHDITLLSLVGPDFRPEHADALRPVTSRIATFGGGATGRRARIAGRARQLAMSAGDAPVRALRDAVAAELAGGGVDAVVLSGKRTFPVLDVVGDTPLVVDLCDATSSRLQGEARHARPLRRADLRLQQIAMRRIERALIARGQQLLVATERDRDLLLGPAAGSPAGPGEGADRAVVVPNGVDVDRWSRSSPTLGSAVAFCGNLAYPPNEDAARQLVDEVMPQVWAHRPDTEVLLVGRGASTSLREAVRDPRVTVTGFVPDVRPLLERAAVFVAPLRFGAGIQNKLLEAMAMEIPVVTSALAADGLRTGGDEPPVGIADDPAAMAALVVARLDDATADPTPDRRGRSWVGERFAWDRSAAGLRAAIARAVAGEPRPC